MFLLSRFDFRRLAVVACFAVWGLFAGCGDESGVGKTVPVHGKIMLNDNPLTEPSTIILFKPNKAKGNASAHEPAGTVDAQGDYSLSTKGKKGAPPGWYKVVVTVRPPRPEHAKTTERKKHTELSFLPPKYGRATTTDLEVEVVESPVPGAYDLTLAK
jgi:hypothetical protein